MKDLLSILFYVLLQTSGGDPFAPYRQGLCKLLMAIFGLAAIIMLGVVIVYVLQGDKDGAKKLIGWLMCVSVGFILFAVVGAL
jgi:hypothetical protein